MRHASPLVVPTWRRAVAAWLGACCLLVLLLIVVGGVTRLTHSGLSITEWQPLVGALPPLSAGDWQQLFDKYRETPEFILKNHWMTVGDFKSIFWLEYIHRLLGRLIGAVLLLPWAWFLWRRALSRQLNWRLAAIFLAGGLQGAVGWLMVKSGLIDNPRVSHLRLTLHLGIALAIYSALLWAALDVWRAPANARRPASFWRWRLATLAFAALAFVTALSGGLVAGIRAGYLYNTFPLMDGAFMPADAWAMQPWWLSAFENATTIQFDHRVLAYAVVACSLVVLARAPRAVRGVAWAVVAAVSLQVCLGIATLLLRVPVPLAAAHQLGAVLVLTSALALAHAAREVA